MAGRDGTDDGAEQSARIRGDDLLALGMTEGPALGLALAAARDLAAADGRGAALAAIAAVVREPAAHVDDRRLGGVARALVAAAGRERAAFVERDAPAPWASFCVDAEAGALAQMAHAMRLPSAVRGALMPDAHQGYGLPIGGVLATEGTVVPYAVGVDIACRMRLTVLDLPPGLPDTAPEALERALLEETVFGTGAALPARRRADHAVLDRARWDVQPLLSHLRERATAQLGTSGSGNHFVELGELEVADAALGIPAGRYLALLSHSGSRGPGAEVARHFTTRARALHRDLPSELSHLAWLELGTDDGDAYWQAMELMGDFAAASHETIHARVVRHLRAEPLLVVENHHNYAWRERHDGRVVIVHRKGATPAGAGALGVIPGSMATPGFVVRGRGSDASLDSASHGAGRAMSRTAARQRFTWQELRPLLAERRVRLLAAGIDENPLAYKDIERVMAAQADLVDVLARFDPRVVRMAEAGERPED